MDLLGFDPAGVKVSLDAPVKAEEILNRLILVG